MPDEIAERLVDDNRIDEAIARLETVLEKKEDAGTRLRLASLQFQSGKLGDALANARHAAETESEHRKDAVLLVAYVLRNLKRYREAAKMFLSFADEFPESNEVRTARFSAALCMEELDDWGGAIEVYQLINDDESDFRRAICLERGGRPDEAAEIFEEFLARHADSPEMLKVRYRLGAMRLRQGRTEEAITHLDEAARLGPDTFIGQLATQLADRGRAKQAQVSKKLRGYT